MSKNLYIAIGIIIVVLVLVFTFRSSPVPENSQPLAFPLTLEEQNGSGQNGTATLSAVSDSVAVTIQLDGAASDAAQPAHIHEGTCATPGAVKYPLADVTDGQSQTTLGASWNELTDLAAQTPLIINVHKSTSETNVYVACGAVNGLPPITE